MEKSPTKRLHCNGCTSDRIYKSHQNHKHYGQKQATDTFVECPGNDCERCQR